MKEQVIVNLIEKQLNSKLRYYSNIYGSTYSRNGTPDFLTVDDNGILTGIEAKVDGKSPAINQWRNAIRILNSNGRYIVAQSDFDITKMDDKTLPTLKIGNVIGVSEFELDGVKIKGTTEIII